LDRAGVDTTEASLFKGIEHVTIAAKDPKALARWYCSTLGFSIVYESARSLTTYVRLGESLLEIIEAGNVERVSHGERDPGFRHIAISVTDIHRAYEDLRTTGVAFRSEPQEKEGVWTAFFEDPEHNLLHLIQRSRPL
jgi:catechol 2,3-dioxygenase-like lactoylglutathione lyase family enzyme